MNGLIGRIIAGRYRVDAFLGRGGMAEVYKVWDTQRSVYLAMKMLNADLAEDKVFLRRFRREAETLSRLQHPNIVRFYGLEQDERLVFILMDYVDGISLRSEIFDAKGPFSSRRVMDIIQPVCAALQYAHNQGFVHCDIKPANIMVDKTGRVLVSDFGIARMTESATATMVGAGTPAYMSPEQARGEMPSPQTDVYALGVVLFEMLTGGERPFTGEHARTTGSTSEKVRWEQMHLPPPSLRQLNSSIPPELEAVVKKCLEKEPGRRYANVIDLLMELERVLPGAGGVEAQVQTGVTMPPPLPIATPLPPPPQFYPQPPAAPPEEIQPQSKLKSRRWVGWAAGGCAGLLLLTAGIVAGVRYVAGSLWPTPTSIPWPTRTPQPTVVYFTPVEPVQIRWFVGLGTGNDPVQVPIEQAVVADFNATHDNIELVLEVIPYDSAKDTLAAQIAAGAGPDVIGPVGWGGSNAFYGQWLDISPYMDQVDQSLFNPALMGMYQTEEGQVGLPFAMYPSMMYYNPALFDQAGLNYPPANYGDRYVMPDGREVDWSYDTVAGIGRLLTIDVNGNNATSRYFDRENVVQFGFHWVWENHAAYFGAYFTAGSLVQGGPGNYYAVVPDAWKDAWYWHYDGIWGDEPFIPNAGVAGSPEFGSSNTFASGRIAMAVLPNWYLCCLVDFANAGNTFDLGILPSYNGEPHGRVDADTLRIWKGSGHPDEAFEVMYWLVTVGIDKLIVGSADLDPAYGAVPAITFKQQPFLDTKARQYPFVSHWDTMFAGLSYPDVPSAEGWMPNYNDAWARLGEFSDRMNDTPGFDLAAEIAQLEDDLRTIFNK